MANITLTRLTEDDRKQKSGRPVLPASRQGISISMSTNAGSILSNSSAAIIRNGIVIQGSTMLIRPLILTLVLGTIYFGPGKIKKGGISPILLICLSAVAGIAAYGF